MMQRLLDVARLSCGRVVGSAASMRSFRGVLTSLSYAFGPFTAFPTINPGEVYAPPVLRLGGCVVEHDANGVPTATYPAASVRNKVVAACPSACAVYFRAAINAVRHWCYGWPVGSRSQAQPDCVFGQVRCVAMASLLRVGFVGTCCEVGQFPARRDGWCGGRHRSPRTL
jgi:hypothetical protein